MLSSGPVRELSSVNIAAGHGVIHSTNGAVLRVRVMHGEEEFAVLLGGEPIIDFRHFAIEIDQFSGLHAAIGRLGVELPADVVALGPAIVGGLPTRVS